MPIYSLNIERHVLGGLINNPKVYSDICMFVTENDFTHDAHQTIFSVIKSALQKDENIDKVVIAQRITNLGISFKDDINIFDYLDGICYTQITPKATVEACQELKNLTLRRHFYEIGTKLQKTAKLAGDRKGGELIAEMDKIYGEKVLSMIAENEPEDVFKDLEQIIEEIGNNPPDPNQFMFGPFETINRIYGSLVRPGAINLVGARTGIGKTSLGMFYLTFIAEKYKVPILHLDFSEMSKLELQMRSVCMLSEGKVSFHAVESGEWRKSPELTTIVRSLWPRVKELDGYYHYYDIGNMCPEEIFSLIRRFYYTKVGRGNRFIVHYDYLKPFEYNPNMPEYKEMGHFVHGVKRLINNEIPASLWASIQLNRSGIINNKNSSEVDDSENSFTLSDRIIQQVTHAWLARPKLMDEIAHEAGKFGNSKLLCVKHRHLGKDYADALNPVKLLNGKMQKNYINMNINSFYFEDRGDLKTSIREMEGKVAVEEQNGEDNGDL
jgi:replicative DNA helicase